MSLTFPGGTLKTVTISATAGDQTSAQTPGAGVRWVFLSTSITLVAGADVGNRYVNIKTTDSVNTLDRGIRSDPGITAGQTKVVDIVKELGNDDMGMSELALSRMQYSAIVEGTDEIVFSIQGGFAGDSYSGFMRVLEFGGA